MKMNIKYIGVFLMVTAIGAGSDSPSIHELQLDHCLVKAVSDVELAARMSGVIQSISVHEGSEVAEKQCVLKIDDSQAVISSELAKMTWKQVKERSEDITGLNFSKASASVAESEYHRALNTNQSVANAISEMQIEKLEMEMKKAQIGVKKSLFDNKQSDWDQVLREKEWQIAEENRKQHALNSPVSGTIVKKYKSVGEWVNQGEPVFRIVKMDSMRVQGFIDLTRVNVQEVMGKTVKIDIKLARNRTVTFIGKVVHVNPMVQAGELVHIEAELTNRKENGQWVIIPGMSADMRIQLDDSSKRSKSLPITQIMNTRILY